MAQEADLLVFLLQLLVLLLLPLGLMLILYLMARRYRGMFQEIGFSKKEMGLLITGSLAALLVVPAQLPLVFFQDYFLAVSLSGAIIPVVLSVHLLRAKRVPWRAWLPGTFVVSLVAYLITRVQPNAGIVAEFPYYLLPAATAALLALILFSRSGAQAPAFGYATATLGSLIGADAYHLPELFQTREFVGSIGGAGVFDLVFLGGLMAVGLVLLFAGRRLRSIRAKLPHREVAQLRLAAELREASAALMYGQYQLSAQRSLGALQAHIDLLEPDATGSVSYPDRLARIAPDPWAQEAYAGVARCANLGTLDFGWARWALLQSQALLGTLGQAERQRYAGAGRRAAAFLVDATLMGALVVGLAFLLLATPRAIANQEVLVLTVFYWAFIVQVVYFTLFEHFWNGRTPGKWLTRIRVEDANGRPLDFVTVFARNTVRLLDLFLFAYLVSVTMIAQGARRQRIGDRVADTVVVRERPPAKV